MEKTHYQIEDVAAKTGLTKRALRYYEDIELITPLRTDAGYRLYTQEDVEKVLRIKEIKEALGFSLSDIKTIIQLDNNLKDIFSGKNQDKGLIKSTINGIREHVGKVKEKQEILARNARKSEEVLDRLYVIYNNLKGENS